MKPVVSGAVAGAGGAVWEDIESLRRHANVAATLDEVSPYRFLPPIAPHLAAREAGVEIRLDVIAERFAALAARADAVVVEGVGGFLVPLGARETVADLAARLGLPLLLVVGMRLGCLNHALLTREAIAARGLAFAGWVANRIDLGMARYEENLDTLKSALSVEPLGALPFAPDGAAVLDMAAGCTEILGMPGG
jgi:dethiobiotin synthetase